MMYSINILGNRTHRSGRWVSRKRQSGRAEAGQGAQGFPGSGADLVEEPGGQIEFGSMRPAEARPAGEYEAGRLVRPMRSWPEWSSAAPRLRSTAAARDVGNSGNEGAPPDRHIPSQTTMTLVVLPARTATGDRPLHGIMLGCPVRNLGLLPTAL